MNAIFTCDVGTPIAWTGIVGSFNHGSMANAMLHAIGAQAACRGRQVISFSGDGGFSMMMGDFLTLVQMKLPVKIILLNNGTLGFVELEMKANGFVDNRLRSAESELRRHGAGGGGKGYPCRKTAGSPRCRAGSTRSRRSGIGGCRECAAGAHHAGPPRPLTRRRSSACS